MPDLFHNPYNFVPLGPSQPPATVARTEFAKPDASPDWPHLTHAKYDENSHSGRLVCKVTVETPLICGNEQEESATWTKRIKAFELEQGKPALPASALRGMISSMAEAASHSALRVLKGDVMSFRRNMNDEKKLSALGIIERDVISGEMVLRPLAVPTMEKPQNENDYWLPKDWVASVFPVPAFKVYLGRGRQNYSSSEFRDSSGLALENAQAGTGAEVGPFYGMKLRPIPIRWGADETLPPNETWHRYASRKNRNTGQREPNPAYLIGRQPVEWKVFPWEEVKDRQGYTRGIFRALGLWTPERRATRPPNTKYHELFIPFTAEMEKWPTLPILPEAIERFEQLADQRTEDESILPFEPLGTRPDRNGDHLRLKPGDVVYFLPANHNGQLAVEEVSFSAIWRGRVEDTEKHGADTKRFFQAQHKELLPLSPGRDLITLAEQLFGVVELRDKKQQKQMENLQTFAFASRLRVSHGLLHSAPKEGAYQKHTELLSQEQKQAINHQTPSIPLKNLASPKVPSPALYFRPKANTNGGYIPKTKLNPNDHAPLGRKFYLRRKDASDVSGTNLFVHPDRLTSQTEEQRKVRRGIISQHQSVEDFVRPGSVFYFHLDYCNLSDLELQLLCYVLHPTADFRHALGHGKPLGLGQIKIDIVGLLEVNRQERYREDPLDAPRYHEAWTEDRENWPNDLKTTVKEEKALAAKLKELETSFRNWAEEQNLQGVLDALEAIGNPKLVGYPVHYPQVAGISRNSTAFESELFKWFVDNEKPKAGNHFMKPPSKNSLPALDRHPPQGGGGHGHGGEGPRPHSPNQNQRQRQNQSRPAAPRTAPQPPTQPSPPRPQDLVKRELELTAGTPDKEGRVPFMVPVGEKSYPGYVDVDKYGRSNFAKQHPPGTTAVLKVLQFQKGVFQLAQNS